METQEVILKKRLEEERLKIISKKRTCMFPNCTNDAIGSHVLQRRGILENIVDHTNHFYAIGSISIFNMREEKVFKVERVGINDGYKFLGFCNHHDQSVFKEIETHPIDLHNRRNQGLFTYRTICLELRKQQIYLETSESILSVMRELEPEKVHAIFLEPAKLAVKDLEFFKKEIEYELFGQTLCEFVFTTIELPKKGVCFSASITIDDPDNKHSQEYDEYGFLKESPLAVSVLNYFPYKANSYLIAAYHQRFFCNWTINVIRELKSGGNIDKFISDLLTYRLEFWGISPDLYDQIDDVKKKRFMKESLENLHNFDYSINSEFNLFS